MGEKGVSSIEKFLNEEEISVPEYRLVFRVLSSGPLLRV